MKSKRKWYKERIPQKVSKIRCFVGIKFSMPSAVELLRKELVAIDAEGGGRLRIVPDENLHITLKFIGPVEESSLALITTQLKTVAADFAAIQLQIAGIGSFKSSVWVGVDRNEELTRLAQELESAIAAPGVPAETRVYVPHVTIARFGKGDRFPLSALLEKHGQQQWGTLPVQSICLYRSETLAGGASYSVLDEIPLGTA